jgi:pyrroline-5-carboxylate reductase
MKAELSSLDPTKLRILVVGGGTMGRAFAAGLVESGLLSGRQIVVAEPAAHRRFALEEELGVEAIASSALVSAKVDALVLAVKPQAFPAVAEELHGRFPKEAVVISVMAGVPTWRISEALAHEAVVRAMPNAAAKVRRSTTVWYAGPAVTEMQKSIASTLLGSIGYALEVEDESLLDVATALSGSGPGFLCLAVEALIEGAVSAGMSWEQARLLAAHTLEGTAALLLAPGAHPALLREAITSPGGTTAAGLRELEKKAVRAAFLEAVLAAWHRARELGRES